MDMVAPALDRLFTVYVHKHAWVLLVEESVSPVWPHDFEQTVIAVCTKPECGARLSKEQIGQILNEAQ